MTMLKTALGAALVAGTTATQCYSPATCTAPASKYSNALPMHTRKQWGDSGGYCGSNSVQMNSLMFGNYFSQDQVRKATNHGEGHGNLKDGFEILPTNIEQAMGNLHLTFNSWDVMGQPKPQSPAYKKFLKRELSKGHPVVWFIMCKGDGSQIPYPGSNPNNGRFSHIEPVFAIYSNHSLDDATVYDDDVIAHGSDWDQNHYYRPMHSLVDTPAMDGNCRNAQSVGGGPNEAYPCIYDKVNYGYALTGNVDPKNATLPARLSVNSYEEPNVPEGQPPAPVTGTLTARSLKAGKSYTIFRFDGKENVPTDSNFSKGKFTLKHTFIASAATHTWTVWLHFFIISILLLLHD